jgi:hypothetical protein
MAPVAESASYIGGASARAGTAQSIRLGREARRLGQPARPILVRTATACSPLRTGRWVALLAVNTKGTCPLQGRTNNGCDGV